MNNHLLEFRTTPPEPGPLKPFRLPEIQEVALSNGVPLFFCGTGSLPIATFSVILPAGAILEDAARAGLSTLTASLIESGTRELDAAAIAQRIETLGVRVHVGTSWDAAFVDLTAPTRRLEAAVGVAAHLMLESTFPADEVDRLRHEQLAGIMQRRADPRGLANEMASRYIFAPESPFARPVSGTAGTVGGLQRSDALEFHRAYSPSGAGVVVAGDIDIETAVRIAESNFGGWTGEPPPDRIPVVKPRSTSTQVVIVERPGAVQSEIRIGHIGVARDTPDFFAIRVMNTILGGAFSSRLNLNLREAHGFTYGATSGFSMRRTPGPFTVATAVQTEVTGAAVTEILKELRRIREAEVTPEELADARNYVAGTFPLHLQTTDGVASRVAELFIHRLPSSYLTDYAARILAVSADEVLHAASSHIRPEHLTVLVVGDTKVIRPQLEALDIGPVEVVRIESTT